QDLARFRSAGGSYDPALLQQIHHARGAAITDLEPSLQERRTRLALAADHLDAILDQFLVLVAGLGFEFSHGPLQLLMDLEFIAGLALSCDEVHHGLDLLIRYESALRADQAA